jgi:hypothetical protein
VRPYQSFKTFSSVCLVLSIFTAAVPTSLAADQAAQVKLDDIKIFYHGVALDDARQPIDIAKDDLPRLYLELARKALEASRPEGAVSQAVRATQLLNAVPEASPAADRATSLILKLDLVIDALIDENKGNAQFPKDDRRYLGVLRTLYGLTEFKDIPQLEDVLRPFLSDYIARNLVVYKSCSDPDIPVPPNYDSPLWTAERVDLKREDSLSEYPEGNGQDFYYPTEIFFYNPGAESPKGLCALLKRYDIADKSSKTKLLKLAGVICESYDTGESCFWEGPLLDETGKRLTDEKLKTAKYSGVGTVWPNSNGSIKDETCNSCHTGNNAFIFYQGNDLCYNEKFHGGHIDGDSPCFGKRNQWSSPIGYSKGTKINVGSGNRCMGCHDLAVSTDKPRYCDLLKFVTGRLMPPNQSKKGLSWDGPSPGNDYEESVAQLREFCDSPKE